MKRFLIAVWAASLFSGLVSPTRADEKDVTAVLDKAITALGGEEKLSKAKIVSWKSKGTFTINGNDNPFSSTATYQGVDHYRGEIEMKFGDNDVKGVSVLAGEKGWRKFGEMDQELEDGELANEKRMIYLQIVPTTIIPLKGKGFKTEALPDEKVADKPAAVIKVTGPDGKDCKLYFDKESGLPVRMVAVVIGFGGEEFTQESNYSNYKDFDGIKKATKVESKRDGEKFVDVEVSEFKVLDKVDGETFSQPK